MKVLAIGDVCGGIGCRALTALLPALRRRYGADLTIVNGENSADGNGFTEESVACLYAAGADAVTGGNHSLRRPESLPLLDRDPFLLRPENLPCDSGTGFRLLDLGRVTVALLNLSGQFGMEKLGASSFFDAADEMIARAEAAGARVILVDFHAEATSEKRALGLYLDGRVSAVFGTHTHVQTADACLLPKGTGYITDLGMTGPEQSVLGVRSDIIIERFRSHNTRKFELADGPCLLTGCLFTIDERTGRCLGAEAVSAREEVRS